MARSRQAGRHRRVREAATPRYAPAPTAGIAGVLYDSDIVIDILRGREAVVNAARDLEAAGVPTFCTAITWAEIFAGLRPGEEPVTRAFFEVRGEVVIDAATGERAGAYMARYARSHGVELADAFIAAAAASAGLRLWTRNRRHYPMPDLKFYTP